MKVYGRRSVIEAIKSNLEIQKAFIKKNAINMEEIIFKLKKKNILYFMKMILILSKMKITYDFFENKICLTCF